MQRLNVQTIALAGASGQALAFGPGHVGGTAEPGERGIAVYSAHRDTHFRFLKDVAIGDEITVTRRDGRTVRYRADRSAIVRFDQSGLDPLTGGHELVLSTCWPFDAVTPGPLRYLLHATLIDEGGRLAGLSGRPAARLASLLRSVFQFLRTIGVTGSS